MAYDLYPAVDEQYNFPPEIRQSLAISTELRNGVVPMSTTIRNNLMPSELWDGRVIANTTIDRLERYDAGLAAWSTIADLDDAPNEVIISGTQPSPPSDLWIDTSTDPVGLEYTVGYIYPFANAAARDAAIPLPSFGHMCRLQDSGTIQCYNGFVWVGDTATAVLVTVNGWVGSAARYRIDFQGVVHASGLISTTGASSVICATLPANYRPAEVGHNTQQYTKDGSAYASGGLFIPTTGIMEYVPNTGGHSLSAVRQVGFIATWRADFLAFR